MSLKRLRAGLVTVILLAVTIRIILWTVEPMIPYVISGIVLITIVGFVFRSATRL